MSLSDSDTGGTTTFSRSTGLPARLGKATETLKCMVPECVKDDWTRLARSLGLTESQLLLSVVMVRLDGLEKTLSMQQEQLRAAVGIGQESVGKASDATLPKAQV